MDKFSSFRPLADRVVVKDSNIVEKSKGGIFLAGNAREKPEFYEVVAVSEEGFFDGHPVDMVVKVGDKIIANRYAGTELSMNGEDFIIIHQADILAILED